MPPAGAPSESKKPHAVHEAATAAMGATAKTKSSKPLAPGSHAAAPDNVPTSLPPSPAKSSTQPTGKPVDLMKDASHMNNQNHSTNMANPLRNL